MPTSVAQSPHFETFIRVQDELDWNCFFCGRYFPCHHKFSLSNI